MIALVIAVLPLFGIAKLEMERCQLSSRFAKGENYYLPPAPVLRALSFGYNELGADLLWVRTIAYFTDHLRDRELEHLNRYLHNVLALDDHFKEVYRFGPIMLASRGDRQTNDDIFAAIELLKAGHKNFPEEYRFPLALGSYYLFDLGSSSNSKEKKDRWRRMGADWLHRAVLMGAQIPWLPSLAANIYSEQGQRELAIQHLQEIYLVTQDPNMRSQIALKLKHMRANQAAVFLKEQTAMFNKEWQSSPIAFVSSDLYALVGLRPLKPFSVEEVYFETSGSL